MKTFALAVLLVLSVDAGFGQVTYEPVTIAFPQIAVGGDASSQNYVTLLQIVNNNSAATTGRLALYSDSGSPLAALFDGQGPQSTLDVTLAGGETRQIQITLNGAITAGWLQINYSPSNALTTVILQFRSGATLLSEVGVQPAFNAIGATDFAAETDSTLNTGIAIVNPGTGAASVLARLWDSGTGTLLSNTIFSIPPNGHVARLLTELFPSVANISQMRAQLSLDSCSTAACTVLAGPGFVATALRLNGDQFTTIPVAQRTDSGDQVRILPQVAFGGAIEGLNMKTVLYFTTNVPAGVSGAIEIFDNDGNPLEASADDAPPSAAITFTVPGNRVSRIVLSGDQALRSGWARLTLSTSAHLIANAVFQTFEGANLVSEASVLESAAINRGLIYVKAQSGSSNVGLALANSQPTPTTIALKLFDREGFLVGSRDITLPGHGHLAQFVTEIFPEVTSQPNFDGALFMNSATSFSPLALRLSAGKIAALPVESEGMYRPSIVTLRATGTQRSPAQVNFEVDVADFDSDLALSSATTVIGEALVNFGAPGYDRGPVSMDGAALVSTLSGTLRGSFVLPHVSGAVPSGTPAVLYMYVVDLAGNVSNVVYIPITF